MSEIIYVDVLVILNLIINFFLLLAVELFVKEKAKRWRLFFASLIGGLYSLVVFLPEMGIIVNFFLRMLCAVLMSFVAFGYKTLRRFIKICLSFIVVTFLFAGLMLSLWILFKPSGMFMNNSAVYFGISFPVLVATTAVCYIISRVLSRFFSKNKAPHTFYDFTLNAFGKTLSGKGLFDTGNTACESFSGLPVVVCTYDFVKNVLPFEYRGYFENNFEESEKADEKFLSRFRFVSFKTVSGGGLLPAFKAEGISLKGSEKINDVYVAVTKKEKFINGGFDMLLNANLIF